MVEVDFARLRANVRSIAQHAGASETPVDLLRVSASLGLRVVIQDLGRLDACLIPDTTGRVIKLNSRVPRTRRRFSLAHEIAHAVLEPKVSGATSGAGLYRRERTASSAVERLCDAFAVELIMPEAPFRAYALQDEYVSLAGIERLATVFDTSITAAARRLAETAEVPFVVAAWKPGRREPCPDSLHLSWAYRSAPAKHLRNFYLPPQATAPAGCTAHRAARNLSSVRGFERIDSPLKRPRFLVESRPFGGVAPSFVLSLIRLDRTRR